MVPCIRSRWDRRAASWARFTLRPPQPAAYSRRSELGRSPDGAPGTSAPPDRTQAPGRGHRRGAATPGRCRPPEWGSSSGCPYWSWLHHRDSTAQPHRPPVPTERDSGTEPDPYRGPPRLLEDILRLEGFRPGPWQLLLSALGTVGIINSALVGVTVGLAAGALSHSNLWAATIAGLIAFAAVVPAHQRYQMTQRERAMRTSAPDAAGSPQTPLSD